VSWRDENPGRAYAEIKGRSYGRELPTGFFFNKKAVLDRVGKTAAKALSQMGAYCMRIARNSIRTSKKSSEPGQPPHSHLGTLKRLIFFSYDQPTMSVVIGPVAFRNPPLAPYNLEHGSDQPVANPRRRERKVGDGGEIAIGRASGGTTKLAKNTLLGNVSVTYTKILTPRQAALANQLQAQLYGPKEFLIKPHPFMRPALEKTLEHFGQIWSDAVRTSA
jgi:hypothetical protein